METPELFKKLGVEINIARPSVEYVESFNITECIELITDSACYKEIYEPIMSQKIRAGKSLSKSNRLHKRESGIQTMKPGFYITDNKLIHKVEESFYKKNPAQLYDWWIDKLNYMDEHNINNINDLPLNAGVPVSSFSDSIHPEHKWSIADLMRVLIVNCMTHIINSYLKYGIKDKHKLRLLAIKNIKNVSSPLFYDMKQLSIDYKRDKMQFDADTKPYNATITNTDLYHEELGELNKFLKVAHGLIKHSNYMKYRDIQPVIMAFADWYDIRISDQIMSYNYTVPENSRPRILAKRRVIDFFNRLNGTDKKYKTRNVIFYLPMTTSPDYEKTMYLYSIPVSFFSIVNEIGHGIAFSAYNNIYHDIEHKSSYIFLLKRIAELDEHKQVSYVLNNKAAKSSWFNALSKKSIAGLKKITPLTRKNSSTNSTNVLAATVNNQPGTSSRLSTRNTNTMGSKIRLHPNTTTKFIVNPENIYSVQKYIYYKCRNMLMEISRLGNIKQHLYYLLFGIIHENNMAGFISSVIKGNKKPSLEHKPTVVLEDESEQRLSQRPGYFSDIIGDELDKQPKLKARVYKYYNDASSIGLSYMLYGARIILILMIPEFREIIKKAALATADKFSDSWPAGTMIGNFAHPEYFPLDEYFEYIDILYKLYDEVAEFYDPRIDKYIEYYKI